MTKGKIKWYNEAKGYGFIESEDGEDIFMHRTGLKNPHDMLQTDDKVVFEIKEGEKGLMAVDVKPAF